MHCRWIAGPTALAVIVTLANAIKPVLVDDTAYLAYARQMAAHPLDPYGFTIHWYTVPEPAMDVLAPPVVPYWLALGMRLFGEHILLLKLWLFPFVWIFARSLGGLLRRFARGSEGIALPLIVLSPAVLPMVNLMLDVPAAALALASLAVFTQRRTLRSADSASRLIAIVAGLLAGLAMQTKYTAMLVPAAIAWYGLTHRQLRLAILACVMSVLVFASWEVLLFLKYGESHFLHHVAEQQAATGNWLQEKSALIPGLVGHLGLLGFGIALFAARSMGLSNRKLIPIAILWCIGTGLVAILASDVIRARNVWRPFGTGVLLVALVGAGSLILKKRRLRLSRGSWFVAGWLLLELAGYFVLTPFPAGRRVIGFTIVFGIVAARLLSRIHRIRPERTPPRWLLPFAIAISALFAALDTFDAYPEKVLAERAAVELRGEKRVWFAGHWGFQFYCERAGMMPIIPWQSDFQAGDMLVLPLHPDDRGFYRPHIGSLPVQLPTSFVELATVLEWDDWLSAQTVPNFYGGSEPIVGRDHPRLRLVIYRVTRACNRGRIQVLP